MAEIITVDGRQRGTVPMRMVIRFKPVDPKISSVEVSPADFCFRNNALFEEFSNLLENWKNVRTRRDFRMEIYLKFAPYFTASRFLSLPCIR